MTGVSTSRAGEERVIFLKLPLIAPHTSGAFEPVDLVHQVGTGEVVGRGKRSSIFGRRVLLRHSRHSMHTTHRRSCEGTGLAPYLGCDYAPVRVGVIVSAVLHTVILVPCHCDPA